MERGQGGNYIGILPMTNLIGEGRLMKCTLTSTRPFPFPYHLYNNSYAP